MTWERLTAYVIGDLNPDACAEVEQWGKQAAAHQAILEVATRAWNADPVSDVSTAVTRVHQRVLGATEVADQKLRHPRSSRAWSWGRSQGWVGAVLGCLLVVLTGWMIVRNLPSGQEHQVVRRYATATGQQAIVTLSDGTQVTLAPRTSLSLIDFGADSRTVRLEGEAYFSVAKVSGVPFIVQAGSVRTHVLGTKFLVQQDDESGHIRVAVTQGKVVVTSKNIQHPSVTLVAGWVADVTDSSTTTTAMTDEAPYTGWMNGHLVFYRTPARDVLHALTRWYGYQFRLTDSSLARQTLTAVVSTQSSSAALATLKLLLNVDLVFDGKIVTLKPRNTTVAPPPVRPMDFAHSTHEVGR
jgi:ferric-dicitrate binding protein FerR (iron transport regulator)